MKDFYLNVGHAVQGVPVRRCHAFADAGSRVCPLLNAAETHVGGGEWRGGERPPATGEVRSIRVSSSEKSM